MAALDRPEVTGVLVIRVWQEPGDFDIRARLTEAENLSAPAETTRVVGGVDAVCEAVREWAVRWQAATLEGRDGV